LLYYFNQQKMDKLAEKMNQLPKLSDDDKESNLGYIYGVSGPGILNNLKTNIKKFINYILKKSRRCK
jgi:hypothetical protein